MAASQDRAPDRQAVVTVLRLHGLSGDAIAQLWSLSADMRRRPRRRGLEHAAMVNVETGVTVGSVISGSLEAVDLQPHLGRLVSGRRYVQLHTHPGSTSFSDDDAATILSWEQIQTMVVVGVDGTWYALSRTEKEVASALDAAVTFLVEFDRVESVHPDLSLRERTHVVWLAIADRLGLRHDRIQRSLL